MGDDRLPGEPVPRPQIYECPVCHKTRTAERPPVCGRHGQVMTPK